MALFVDRQHDRMAWRGQIEADDVRELGDELGITAALEAAQPVRLQLVRGPDPLHRSQGQPGSLGHHTVGQDSRQTLAILHRDYGTNQMGHGQTIAQPSQRMNLPNASLHLPSRHLALELIRERPSRLGHPKPFYPIRSLAKLFASSMEEQLKTAINS